MDWKGRRQSSNVEDRRGRSAGGLIGGGIGGVILLLVVALITGNPSQILNTQLLNTVANTPYVETAQEKELAEFVPVVLAETEDVWTKLFNEKGLKYEYPNLVLFTGSVESACGISGSASGPFYCPGDSKVYIDLSFYNELKETFSAPGDFAMAYVIAHEVGHHVQNLLGITDEVMPQRYQIPETEFNALLVRLELQADYFSGVWAHYVNRMNLLEKGDLDEALNAASAVGDDRIQQNMQGYVIPDSFTHGTSEQRRSWFYKGFVSGKMEEGDTFNTDEL